MVSVSHRDLQVLNRVETLDSASKFTYINKNYCFHCVQLAGLTTESDWKSKGGGGGGGGVQPASILRGTKAEAKTLSLVEGTY